MALKRFCGELRASCELDGSKSPNTKFRFHRKCNKPTSLRKRPQDSGQRVRTLPIMHGADVKKVKQQRPERAMVIVHERAWEKKMSDRMEYQVALVKDGRFDTYESASLFTESDDEAVEKAKAWAKSFDGTPEDAWLQVVMSGKGIATLRPGEF